jgi:hypothetical protein
MRMQVACRSEKKESIPHVKWARWQAKHALRAFFRRGREGSFAFAAFRPFSFFIPSPFVLSLIESICSECSVASAESRSGPLGSAGDWEPSLAATFISSCIPPGTGEWRKLGNHESRDTRIFYKFGHSLGGLSRSSFHCLDLKIWICRGDETIRAPFSCIPDGRISTYCIWRAAQRRTSDPKRTVANSRELRVQLGIPPKIDETCCGSWVADRGSYCRALATQAGGGTEGRYRVESRV